jgi:hypothetical protein
MNKLKENNETLIYAIKTDNSYEFQLNNKCK